MSYDIRLVIDTGGSELTAVTKTLCPTYNLRPMFYLALGHPLSHLQGRKAHDLIEILNVAIKKMKDFPAEFKKLNPPNGWGSHEIAVETLEQLLEMCKKHPLASFEM